MPCDETSRTHQLVSDTITHRHKKDTTRASLTRYKQTVPRNSKNETPKDNLKEGTLLIAKTPNKHMNPTPVCRTPGHSHGTDVHKLPPAAERSIGNSRHPESLPKKTVRQHQNDHHDKCNTYCDIQEKYTCKEIAKKNTHATSLPQQTQTNNVQRTRAYKSNNMCWFCVV